MNPGETDYIELAKGCDQRLALVIMVKDPRAPKQRLP